VPSYIFFPDEKRPNVSDDPYAGKTYHDYCGACPVKWKCREFADLHDMQGAWGDLSQSERGAAQSGEDREELREYKGDIGEYWPLYGHS
jgi:hypothetical protein